MSENVSADEDLKTYGVTRETEISQSSRKNLKSRPMAREPSIVRRKTKKRNPTPSKSPDVETRDEDQHSDVLKEGTSRDEYCLSVYRTRPNVSVPDPCECRNSIKQIRLMV